MKILSTFVLLALCLHAQAQIVQTGVKAGFNYSWLRHEDPAFRNVTKIKPVPGFSAGIVCAFKMKDRYFLNTELLYATKGKFTTNDPATTNAEEDELMDRVRYHYIELPLIYNVHFKGQLKFKNARQFKWYAGIGPNFSYWLGGKGAITHYEITEFGGSAVQYDIKFGKRPEEHEGNASYVYVDKANRLQLGINVGTGLLLEPNNRGKFMIDLRFELGHSWLSKAVSTDYVVPTSYDDQLRARNLGGRFSVMYLIESNLDKKVRNKGKSTQKNRKLKRR